MYNVFPPRRKICDAGIDEIECLLNFFAAASQGSASGRGCLLCNTAVEFGPTDPSGQRFVQNYFGRISDSFLNALCNAQKDGNIGAKVNISEEAAYFTTAVLGLFVLIRAKAPVPIVQGSVKVAKEHLSYLSR